jgi:hypothetical protein
MGKANSHSFKPGPDPRRNTKGRGPASVRIPKLAELAGGPELAQAIVDEYKRIAFEAEKDTDRLRALDSLAILNGGGRLETQGERAAKDEPTQGDATAAELARLAEKLQPPADPPPASGTVLPFPPKESQT